MAEVKFLYISSTEQGPAEANPTTDTTSLAGLALTGNLAFTGGAKVTGLPTPTSDTDAATKLYVDNLVSGTPWKRVELMGIVDDSLSTPPVTPTTGDAYIVGATPTGGWSAYSQGDLVQWNGTAWVLVLAGSGSEPADGLKVVVTDGTPAGSFAGQDNNIATYNATTNVWSFEAAADGKAVIIAGEGAVNENTQWVYDSSGLQWVFFGGDVGAGAGLYKSTGNVMNVGKSDGISVGTDDISIDLYATNPGLKFEGTSPNGQLAVKYDGAHGIVTGTSGLELEIDDTPDTLDVDADGLKVVGLPSLFKINNTAVSANVTATNLNTLTAGSSSNADALHTHSITSVEEAQRVEATHVNNSAVTAGRAVRWSAVNNQVIHADNGTTAGARTIGIARTGGAADPGTSEVVKHGICAGCLSGATVNNPYFLGSSGALVLFASIPRPGRVVRMGFAANASDLDVQIMDFGAVGA